MYQVSGGKQLEKQSFHPPGIKKLQLSNHRLVNRWEGKLVTNLEGNGRVGGKLFGMIGNQDSLERNGKSTPHHSNDWGERMLREKDIE
jgi:hypothetical protein